MNGMPGQADCQSAADFQSASQSSKLHGICTRIQVASLVLGFGLGEHEIVLVACRSPAFAVSKRLRAGFRFL
jgi:hypothetical protein